MIGATRDALSVLPWDKCNADQRAGLDQLQKALEQLQLRDQMRRGAQSSAASSVSASGFDASSVASSAGVSASSTGSRRARRRGGKLVYGAAPDLWKMMSEAGDLDSSIADEASEMTREQYESLGYVFCKDSYWLPPRRLGWCCSCGDLDDWKIMEQSWVDKLSDREMQLWLDQRAANHRYPELRKGKSGDTLVYTCTTCIARRDNKDEKLVAVELAQKNKGAGTINHSQKRVAMFKKNLTTVKDHLKVLVGFALDEDGMLALRRATIGVGVGIDLKSTGAPPGGEETSREVGRPMATPQVPGQPRVPAAAPEGTPAPPALSEIPYAAAEEAAWTPTDRGPIELTPTAEGPTVVTEELDSITFLREGYSVKQLKRLAGAYATVQYESLRGQFVGALGSILQKRGDMARATMCSERLTEYMTSLEAVVDESAEMQTALEGEQLRRAQELKSEAAVAAGDAKAELLKQAEQMESHLNKIRAFKKEANGDVATQLVFQKMADYSDQFFSGSNFTMNVYYVCKARKTIDNPNGCRYLTNQHQNSHRDEH